MCLISVSPLSAEVAYTGTLGIVQLLASLCSHSADEFALTAENDEESFDADVSIPLVEDIPLPVVNRFLYG